MSAPCGCGPAPCVGECEPWRYDSGLNYEQKPCGCLVLWGQKCLHDLAKKK